MALQRLGETTEFGSMLLRLLSLDGWEVVRTRAFGGGVLVIARKGEHEIRRSGGSLADVACDVFGAAMALKHEQLEVAV